MKLYLYVFNHTDPVTKKVRETYFYADQEAGARNQFQDTFGVEAGELVRREPW